MQALLRKIRQILKDRRIRRFFTRVVSSVAAIVVFITTYALILPAITLERTAACGVEEHQHNDSCYEDRLVCGQEESDGHHHDDSCYSISSELICRIQEHQHSAENGCYDADGNLVCQLQEHVHDDSCYKEVRTLTCGLEESKGHHHTDACYKKVLICGKEVHTHSAACYQDTGENSDQESESGNAANPAASENPGADSAAAENNTSELTDSDNAATAETVLPGQEVTTPELAPLDFTTILNKDTGVYYYSVKPEEKIEDSSKITDWTRAKDKNDNADDFTELAPEDLIRVYLAYTVPAGSLNTTNPTARYRLPDSIRLSDKQIEAINKAENGISSQYDDKDKHDAALGAEAIEGTRRPDQDIDEYLRKNSEDGQEYINATVKAENVFNDKTGEYEGQDLIFTFTPYTIEKNQVVYDTSGEMTKSGENVRGWFTFDMTTDQVEWGEAVVSSIKTGEETEGESEEAEDIETENVEVDNTAEQADEGNGAEAEENPDKEKTTDVQETAEDTEQEKTSAEETTTSGNKGSSSVIERSERSADIVFVKEGYDVDNNRIEEIATTLKLVEEKEVENSLEDDSDSSNDDTASDFAAGTLEASGEGYKITMEYTAEAQVPENASLSVREITAETDPEAYKECLEQAGKKIASDDSDDANDKRAAIDETASRFFDIEIVVPEIDENGQETSRKIEPKAEVSVNIQMTDTVKKASDNSAQNTNENEKASGSENQGAQEPTVLHFTDDGVEKLQSTVVDDKNSTSGDQAEDREKKDSETAEDTDSAGSKNGSTEIQFTTDSFSIYGVVYTVDFTYNGYQISIPGNASVLLSKLAEELGLGQKEKDGGSALGEESAHAESQDADASVFDINNVERVSFSDDALVRVARVDADTRVSDLLDQLEQDGVQTWIAENVVVRSDEKSDAEVMKEANAVGQVDDDIWVDAGDWVLTGLQAFHSDEELVITMKTGEKYVINVTDLDTATNGVKPSTVTGYDSASAGIKITMFDYGPDKLDNVNNTYNSADNSGINSGHKLKFYSYGTEGSTMNNFTGGAYAMQGIVKTELVNGYPVTNNGENLSYLFDETPSGNNKKVYKNVNGLFLYNDSTGLMHYSSDENYAYMNPTPNSSGGYDFKLYSDTYTEEGADYANPFRIGFFPYNDYDNRYRCIHGDNFRWGCKGQNDRRVRDQVGHYNHHFGMKVEGNFYMTDDKKTPIGDQDMIFEFSGDDDMWVFIDGVLVLDIGGIHNPVDGKINFTTGQVTVSAAKTASGGSSYALGTNTTIANAFAKAGKTWDDSPLSQHEIKIFYMERGGMYSNLEISMNLPTFPEPKQVELWKVNQESEDEKLAGAQFELYSDFACTKPIKATGSNDPVIISSVTDPKGRVLVDNLVPGQTYYLKEIQAPEGYKLDNRVFKIVSPANNDQEAQIFQAISETEAEPLSSHNITNAKDKYGSFDFYKVKEGEPGTKLSEAQFTLYTDMDCTAIAKNKAGQNLQTTSGNNGKLSFSDIPAGKTYYMKETAEPDGYFPSGDVYTVEVDADGNVTVKLGGEVKFTSADADGTRQITNKPKAEKTSISVDKRWSDGAANHTNDTVTVQLYKLETHATINVPVGVTWTGGTPAEGTVTVTIHDQSGDEADKTVTLTAGDNWGSKNVELTEGKTYTISCVSSGNSSITGVTCSNSPLTVGTGSTINVAGTIGNGKMNLTVVYVTNNVLHQYANGSAPYSFNRILNGIIEYDIHPSIQTISNNEYKISNLDVESSGNVYSYNFTPNPGYYPTIYTVSSTNGLGAQISTFNNNPVVSFDAKPGDYTIYILDTGMSAPAGLALSPSSRRSSGRTAGSAPLRSAVSAGNFLNGTHKLPAGAAPEGAPVILNQNHDGKWSHTWTDLVSESNGTKTTYYVVETAVDLANGDNNDVVSSTYEYVYNVDGDESSGIKTVIVTNTVQPKTSLEVTKKWLNADNSQAEDSEDIIFEVHQVVGDRDTVYPDSQTTHTITYNTAENKYGTVEIQNLPTRVKVGNELKDAKYYVVEISPAGGDNLTTYYEAGDKQYADPADAAGSASETIVNKNVSREITVTKEWRYKNGSQVTVADVPPETDVYFKWKKIENGQDAGYFTVDDTEGTGIPESSIGPDDYPEGYVPYRNPEGGNGTIYHLICTPASTEHQSELDPEQTYTTTSWSWNTLTFTDLPTGCKYLMVETDSQGNELLSDAVGTQITYVDENGKLITESSPIDPAIPGNYTIRNTEHRTSLYAQKVWHGANKDNLAGNESVWFSLMRVETDGNGNYALNTLEETPGVGRFALKESSGWVKYFDSIEVAPPERHANDTYKYYQYFIVELGLLDQSTADKPDNEKTYSLINNMHIKYQSKGSGTAADGSVAEGRDEFKPYGQSVDLAADNNVTGSRTVTAWINALKDDSTLVSRFLNDDMIRLRTWESSYDGMGTLGAFNSSQEFLEKPLEIKKVWKDANGNDLSSEEINEINASGEGDHYQVEIQLMQHAYNLTGKDASLTYDVPYGSTFMVDPGAVIMQSDMFEVTKKGTNKWEYEIPALNSENENQLPVTGAFRIPGSAETVQAHFEYYVSEYRVYNNEGDDVTTLWSAACVKNTSGDTYSLQLENRKTTDLVLHKNWENVPAENRTWVDDNVQAVLFKVWRKAQGETGDANATDITEYIAARPSAYGLTAANVFDVELDGVYEDFVRVDKPEDGWAINDTGSVDAAVTIDNLDALVKDYLTDANAGGGLSNWPRYQYWVEEWGYVDAKGSFQFIETLLHGNTKSSADYPKYQQSTGSSTVTLTAGGTAGYGSSAVNALKPAESTIGKSTEITLGAEGQNHLGAVNTVRGVELSIIKTDNASTPKKLTGAQFELTRKDADGSWLPFSYLADTDANAETDDVSVTTQDEKFTITAEDGYIIKNLMPGQYKLKEVKSPDGYIIQFSPLDFEVTLTGKIVTPGTNTELTGGTGKHFTYTAGTTAGKASGTITVQNEPGASLPATGGPGTTLIYLLGIMLTAFAGAGLAMRKRRRDAA